MGELLRVHRATVAEFRGEKQMTANVHFNSSWAIFPLFVRVPQGKKAPTFADEFHTELFHGKECRVTADQIKIIRDLRTWARKGFEERLMVTDKYI